MPLTAVVSAPDRVAVVSQDDLRTQWDRVAAEIAAGRFSFRDETARTLLEPAIRELIGSAEGLRILDAGCGDGWLTAELNAAGSSVTAVDFSTGMTDIARRRLKGGNSSTVHTLDIQDLPSSLGSFDLVVSSMVLMAVPDLETVVKQLSLRLTSAGRLLVAVLHPCFLSLNDSPNLGWLEKSGAFYPAAEFTPFVVDQYFDRSEFHPQLGHCSFPHFHHTVADYIQAARKADLVLTDLREPQAKAPSPAARLAYYLLLEFRPLASYCR